MFQAIKCKLKKCCQITWRLLTLTALEDFLGYLLKTFSISGLCSNHQSYDLDEPLMEFWLFLYFCFQYIFRGPIEFRFGKPEDFWIAGLCAELITNNIFTCYSIFSEINLTDYLRFIVSILMFNVVMLFNFSIRVLDFSLVF